MKILLIVYDNESYISWFPQGLAYLAAVLREDGHEITIYTQDIYHTPDSHITKFLDENRFDVVGVGVIGGYYQYKKLLGISSAINASKHRPFFVIGGHGPSPDPQYFLEKTEADAAIIGEGEESTKQLVRAIEAGSNFENIKGLAYREGDAVVVNPRMPLILDVDSIPMPAYDLFPISFYRLLRVPKCSPTDLVMPVLSGRGCTFECTFCYRMDKGFRPRANEAIIEEIRILKKDYNINYIVFSDELLMSSIPRTTSLCEDIISANLNIKWWCNGRLNYAKPDILRTMKKAGCVFINYGIESMDEQVLKNMKKGLTKRQIISGIEATLAAGISPGFNFIFGNIGDTQDTLQKSVDFLLNYDDGSQLRTIRPVTPYPGSELYYQAIRDGSLKDCADFYENKHINSDLVSLNFTEMSDENFHRCLHEANSTLISNYYANLKKNTLNQADDLYKNLNESFRGFRQT